MKKILKFVAALAFVASVGWLIFEPKFDSIVASLTSLAALIALYVVPTRDEKTPNQTQKVSKYGTAIQAGRDVNIGCSENNKEGK